MSNHLLPSYWGEFNEVRPEACCTEECRNGEEHPRHDFGFLQVYFDT